MATTVTATKVLFVSNNDSTQAIIRDGRTVNVYQRQGDKAPVLVATKVYDLVSQAKAALEAARVRKVFAA